MSTDDVVILSGCRTPIGSFGGAFKDVSAVDLGAVAVKEAVRRSGARPDQVDEVILGCILQAGLGMNPARQASIRAGIPESVPAHTVNKVCGSGLKAVMLAAQAVKCGDAELIVAGGTESMSGAPYLLPGGRWGERLGNGKLLDHMIHEGLTDAFHDIHMGITAENIVERYRIPREDQDAFAAESQARAEAAIREGRFKAEIVPVPVAQKKGEPKLVDTDEYPRPGTTAETLARLRPAFSQDGTITAGTSSQISDGAAAVVVTSAEFAERAGLNVIAEIGAHGNVAGPDNSLHSQPSNAIKQALAKAGRSVPDLDLIEINEAFAVVALQSMRELGVGPDVVNVNGGAIAIGHPIGASGARLAVHLCYELGRRGGGLGAAALCGGGGQGEALLLRVRG